jgi:hypothetical protein
MVVLLLVAGYVFYLYAFARGLQEIVGRDFTTVLASCSFSLVLLVPMVWVVALPDLPRILWTHRARRRWLQGLCPKCGLFVLHEEGSVCPECGADRSLPASFRPGSVEVRRLAVIALAAWFLGCIASETWASLDETVFAREAEAHVSASPDDEYSRPRRWPMQDQTLYYTQADGVMPYAPDIVLRQY